MSNECSGDLMMQRYGDGSDSGLGTCCLSWVGQMVDDKSNRHIKAGWPPAHEILTMTYEV